MSDVLYNARVKVNKFLQKIKFDKWKGWIYLAPAVVLLAVFTVYPIYNTILCSLINDFSFNDPFQEIVFGFKNFEYALEYPNFVSNLKVTLILTVITVPLSTFLALLVAVCLNSIKFLQKGLQTIFFLPYVTNSIAIGMVFFAMFNVIGSGRVTSSIGLMNTVLDKLGLLDLFFDGDPINWIHGEGEAIWPQMTVLVVYIVWNALPFKILILLGGLQSVNKQYYEAAKVDGTSRARTFWRITVPLLSPMLTYVIITGFIGGFKEYSSLVGIFGEPGDQPLNTIVGFVYASLMSGSHGLASAAALILFAIIFVVTMLNLYVSKKTTHY